MKNQSSKLYSRFLRLSRKAGLPIKQILDLFFVLKSGQPLENNKLLRQVGVSKNVLNQAKQALSDLLKPPSSQTQLTSAGLKKIKTLYGSDYLPQSKLFSFLKDRSSQKALRLLETLCDQRPEPKREYDQFPATPQTVALRASLLDFLADIKGKKLLFLGDNDLTSLVVASYQKAAQITVLDIDDQVLQTIQDISQKQEFDIKTLQYDAREKLPSDLEESFDIVFTDPPYTPNGFSLFISRSIDTLDKKNKAARIYTCYGNSDKAKERFLPIQKIITQSGLMIRWVFDKFNRYYGAQSIGSTSSLYVAETTPKIEPLIKGNYQKPIYTHQ